MSIASNARSTAIMNKVKGNDPFAFSNRFKGYSEATEGIVAQQMEADRRLREIQAQRAVRIKTTA